MDLDEEAGWAAVLVARIVGGDTQAEANTLRFLLEIARRGDGTVLNTAGDQVACAFRNAQKCLAVAVEMQTMLRDRPVPTDSRVRIAAAIGFYWGRTLMGKVEEGDDIVRAAAELAAIATPDQILTTEEAQWPLGSKEVVALRGPARVRVADRETVLCQVEWDEPSQRKRGLTEATENLELARAYLGMGDDDGARALLHRVLQHGDAAQRSAAQDLLRGLLHS